MKGAACSNESQIPVSDVVLCVPETQLKRTVVPALMVKNWGEKLKRGLLTLITCMTAVGVAVGPTAMGTKSWLLGSLGLLRTGESSHRGKPFRDRAVPKSKAVTRSIFFKVVPLGLQVFRST